MQTFILSDAIVFWHDIVLSVITYYKMDCTLD